MSEYLHCLSVSPGTVDFGCNKSIRSLIAPFKIVATKRSQGSKVYAA